MVIVVPAVRNDGSATEVISNEFKCFLGSCGLGDRELMLDLPAETALFVPHNRDREASFTIREPDYPLVDTRPFLLIVRTARFITSFHIAQHTLNL